MEFFISSILFIFFSSIFILLIFLHSITKGRKTKLPPGPKGSLIIGNLLQIGDKPHKSLALLSKSYGPIMSLKLGQITLVVISSAAMAKEVLKTHDEALSSRTIPDSLTVYDHHKVGFPWLPVSDIWKTLRKASNVHLFSHKVLDGSEIIRSKKIRQVLASVGESAIKGEAIDIGKAVFMTTLNMMSFCWVKVLFPAGTDTTTSTIQWAMAELLRHPEIMEKAQTELRQVIGKDKTVEESDFTRFLFLRAVVKETLRLHPPAPLLIPRKAKQDTEIKGFIIPKHSQILINAWEIGRDSKVWEDPFLFNPERFLISASDIDFKGRNFELIPFGAGRRICPGLPLANRMVHFILASFIHSFDWKLEDGVNPQNMNMDEKSSLTLDMAHPLKAIPILV